MPRGKKKEEGEVKTTPSSSHELKAAEPRVIGRLEVLVKENLNLKINEHGAMYDPHVFEMVTGTLSAACRERWNEYYRRRWEERNQVSPVKEEKEEGKV